MKKYEFEPDRLAFIEGMRQPFAVSQFLHKGVVTLAVSDGFCELFGYKNRAEAYSDMNQNMFKDVHPDDTARFTNAILKFGVEDEKLEVLYRTKKKDESGYRLIHLSGEHVKTDDGTRLAQIWFTDEGDYEEEDGGDLKQGFSKELRDKNLHDAVRYDYLTGLPNMSSFFELCEVGRKNLLDQGKLPALLYIDLSGMKAYNHRYGFSEGDRLLRSFAQLLSRTFGDDKCSHINADRFAVFTEENGLEDKIFGLFREWREMEMNKHLPICIGIYQNQVEDVPAGMAYDRAKIACDSLKGALSSTFRYYNDAMSEGIVRQQYILENFERALSERWIQVYSQPIVRAVSGKVCDEEALARWIDPVRGTLAPAEFIPYLEDSGWIYKLDLYVLDGVLEIIKEKEARGLYIVPHSVNLSRSDFDACDMVEEIRRRVDDAGVSRDRISIEITESVIGSDFEYMKNQVDRFKALGFPVWMDDFGSGYSSLDVLQSIKFNLLKFDMGFMRRLDENSDGRIILTEMMKMASALGLDTICEGVETESQVRFLQEIGCSKLQGFYFSKPTSAEDVLEYHREHKLKGYENPDESAYYGSICGLNLYDIGVVAHGERGSLQNAYTTLPMCILEIKGNSSRFVRTNQSYRDFFKRFFGVDPSMQGPEFVEFNTSFMNKVVKVCCEQGLRTFYDERMPDGSVVHSFARRIDINPVNGNTAIAIAVLSIREPNERLTADQILSVIEQFGEYMPGGFFIYNADEDGKLQYANREVFEIFGCDSLESFKELTGFTFRGMVHPEDYGRVSETIRSQVKGPHSDIDVEEYRIIRRDGAVRWIDNYGQFAEYDDGNGMFYVFISDITDKYEQEASDKALHSAVIEALTKTYDSVWLISDIKTEKFELFRIDKEMEHLMPANIAVKNEKFSQAFAFYSKLLLEEDRQRFLDSVTPESIVRNTENMQFYSVPYRRVFDNGIRHYRLDFVRLDLPDGKTGIVTGFKNVDEEVRREQQVQESLNHRAAVIEALTRSYDSVWLITDLENQKFELYRIDKTMAHLIPANEAVKISRFTDAFAFYSKLVLEEDRQKFLDALTPEKIAENTKEKKIYAVPFRRVFEDGIRHYQIEFSKLDLSSGETNIVGGFKDVEEEVRKYRQ